MKVSHTPGILLIFDYVFTVSVGGNLRRGLHTNHGWYYVYFCYHTLLYSCRGYGLVSFLLISVVSWTAPTRWVWNTSFNYMVMLKHVSSVGIYSMYCSLQYVILRNVVVLRRIILYCNVGWHFKDGVMHHSQSSAVACSSLVPRPPPFFVLRFSFSTIQYTEAEECKKRGRPGNTYHVNDIWWTRGGRRGGGVHVQITY